MIAERYFCLDEVYSYRDLESLYASTESGDQAKLISDYKKIGVGGFVGKGSQLARL